MMMNAFLRTSVMQSCTSYFYISNVVKMPPKFPLSSTWSHTHLQIKLYIASALYKSLYTHSDSASLESTSYLIGEPRYGNVPDTLGKKCVIKYLDKMCGFINSECHQLFNIVSLNHSGLKREMTVVFIIKSLIFFKLSFFSFCLIRKRFFTHTIHPDYSSPPSTLPVRPSSLPPGCTPFLSLIRKELTSEK